MKFTTCYEGLIELASSLRKPGNSTGGEGEGGGPNQRGGKSSTPLAALWLPCPSPSIGASPPPASSSLPALLEQPESSSAAAASLQRFSQDLPSINEGERDEEASAKCRRRWSHEPFPGPLVRPSVHPCVFGRRLREEVSLLLPKFVPGNVSAP